MVNLAHFVSTISLLLEALAASTRAVNSALNLCGLCSGIEGTNLASDIS